MIANYFKQITEKEYRDSDRVSYSSIKTFIEDGPESLITIKPEIASDALTLGTIVDKLLTTPLYDPLSEYRVVDETVDLSGDTHTSKLLKFLKDNPDITISADDEDGINRVFNIMEFKRPPKLTDDFWRQLEIVKIQNSGVKTISSYELELANQMANTLSNHEYTKDLFNPALGIEVINQAKIFFELEGIKCKAMLDKVLVDHTNKIIYPYDIKTGQLKDFLKNFYKYKYYIQGPLYKYALDWLIAHTPELAGYNIADEFTFIYISRQDVSTPIKYVMPFKYSYLAMNGYTGYNGVRNKGIKEILKEIKWHKQENIYNTSKEIFDTKGTIYINIPVEYEQTK